MNPLPRLLSMAIFVVLAVLVALLAAPAWQRARDPRATVSAASTANPNAIATPAKLANFSQRATLGLGAIGLVLAGTLVFSLLGAVFAFLAGLVALKWLSSWLETGRWYLFGVYCLLASAVVFYLHTQGY